MFHVNFHHWIKLTLNKFWRNLLMKQRVPGALRNRV